MNSWFFLPFPRAVLDLWSRGFGRGEEPGGDNILRLIRIRLTMLGFALWVYETLVVRFCACPVSLTVHGWVKLGDPRIAVFEFHKRSQLFLRVRNETLSVAAMSVSNPDRSPFTVDPMGKSDSSVTFCGRRT